MEPTDVRILIVDDDAGIREYLTIKLTTEGYIVFKADSALNAKEILKKNTAIDLILLDVIMPGVSGFDLLKDLKSDPEYMHIPVIMITGLGLVKDKELAFRLGAGDYLTKPFDSREMLARIRTHISLKRKTDEININNHLLTTILETVPGIVYMKDAEKKFLHINQVFQEIIGLSPPDIIGKTDDGLLKTEVAEAFHRSEELIFSYGIPYLENIEHIPNASGETRSYLFRRQPVRDSDGIISGLVGVGVDLTEQILLRSILSDRETFLSTLMNTFPARIWAMGRDGLFSQQNSNHIAKWGNLIGKSIGDIQTDEKTKNDWIIDYQDALKGINVNKMYPGRSNDNCSIVVRWINPIFCNDEIAGVLGISFDVSDDSVRKLIEITNKKKGMGIF